MDSGRQVRLNSGLPWNGNEIGRGTHRAQSAVSSFSLVSHHYPRALPLTLADEIVALEKLTTQRMVGSFKAIYNEGLQPDVTVWA
jgi:hypothetical protein